MRYVPHDYQKYATDFILSHPVSAVFLEMGLGKSVITLTAIYDLCLSSFDIGKVLVISPLRVARDTWPSEIKKFRTANPVAGGFSVLYGIWEPLICLANRRKSLKHRPQTAFRLPKQRNRTPIPC